MKAHEIDEAFEAGADTEELFDYSSATRLKDTDEFQELNTEKTKVNVDCPQWMVDALDAEATRIGITRQSLIKTWIDERIRARRKRR